LVGLIKNLYDAETYAADSNDEIVVIGGKVVAEAEDFYGIGSAIIVDRISVAAIRAACDAAVGCGAHTSDKERLMADKTIYIAVSGCYSDYRINAVFDDESLCDEFIKRFEKVSDELRKEVHDVNPFAQQVANGLTYYRVDVTQEGAVSFVDIRIPIEDANVSTYVRRNIYGDARIAVHCWARDEQHATKIATDKRLEVNVASRWEEEGPF